MPKPKKESVIIGPVSYDDKTRVLTVEFKTGKTYRYSKVHPDVYRDLMKAKSQGSYFWQNIRNKYEYEEIGNV